MSKTKGKRQADIASHDVATLVRENIDRVEAYIKQHLPALAKVGWEGQKEHGRGYVCLDSLPPTHQTYCTKKDSAVPYQYVAPYVEKYDPQREIVVTVSFPGGHVYTSICSIVNAYPLAKEEALLMGFIHHNWVVLAAMAWHGYQDNGKGFLYLDNLPPSKNLYVSARTATPETSFITPLIEAYNPDKAIVIVYYSKPVGGVLMYTISADPGQPDPPEAYRLHKERSKSR